MRFRKELAEAGSSDPELAKQIIEACRRDIVFYANTFCFLVEPRDEGEPVIPWITYAIQDETLRMMGQAVKERRDMFILKSRAQGGSWCAALFSDHSIRFKKFQKGLLLSRVEALVDSPDDPDSLFWKVDFLGAYLPAFLDMPFKRSFGHKWNPSMQSGLDGVSSAAHTSTGRRCLFMVMDEFGKMDHAQRILDDSITVTYTRIIVSSAAEPGGAWHRIWNKNIATAGKPIKQLMHWTKNPDHAKGLYYDQDGAPRSPWYDMMDARLYDNKEMRMRDLDCLFVADTAHFFKEELVAKLIKDCRDPDLRQSWNSIANSLVECHDGLIHQWTVTNPQPPDGSLEHKRYGMGIDISLGVGASNSTISIVDTETGEKVLEYANAWIEPLEFAKLAVLLAKMYNDAYMIWEYQGAGVSFGNRVIELGYRNVYYRRKENIMARNPTDTPGWHNDPDTAKIAFNEYREALANGLFVNHSEAALTELRQYQFTDKGGAEHSEAKITDVITQARANHGDRVIADMLAYKAMRERPYYPREKAREFPYGSFAWRRAQRVAANASRFNYY